MSGSERDDVMHRAGWLPAQEDLERWLAEHLRRSGSHGRAEPHPVVVEFQRLIEGDPLIRMDVERMVEQVPAGKAYRDRPVKSVAELLGMIDEVLHRAPEFGEEMASTPLAAVLDWAMGTPSGFTVFRNPDVNRMLHRILDAWSGFLSGPDSRYVLSDTPNGWLSEDARRTIGIQQYEHDPAQEHFGFTSWNDFFTRRFKEGERPVADPDDDAVVVNPCESTPYALSSGVHRTDRFWIKRQPYSLDDMLGHDEAAGAFEGGTVYQAYLSATDYHRWHSPVAGTVVRAYPVAGTYFSEADSEGPDATEPADSQGYLAHVAARAVFLIEADDPTLGLIAFVAVGMVDVSSCLIARGMKTGRHVAKGEELGRFQFGGSTMCLVFRKGAIGEFSLDAVPRQDDPDAPLKRVNTRLAVAAPRR